MESVGSRSVFKVVVLSFLLVLVVAKDDLLGHSILSDQNPSAPESLSHPEIIRYPPGTLMPPLTMHFKDRCTLLCADLYLSPLYKPCYNVCEIRACIRLY
ncbi:Uncharacterized protein TCM_034222 [Theobroma cacao]|uniref:Uncharacterized protein n=1 Tax=Theobroma cacao TaxID=3641 RepID=A0A061FDN4_THECC|nr:Uncharacterized protein TCM_034222 [Theobroma cacao]